VSYPIWTSVTVHGGPAPFSRTPVSHTPAGGSATGAAAEKSDAPTPDRGGGECSVVQLGYLGFHAAPMAIARAAREASVCNILRSFMWTPSAPGEGRGSEAASAGLPFGAGREQ
jgi:hypothetical protein